MSSNVNSANRTVPDLVDIDLSRDGDTCDRSELGSLYSEQYHCASRKAVGLDKLFILHMDCQWTTNRLASALSNCSVHLTNGDTLEKVSTFIAHEQDIVDLHFSPADPNTLFTASCGGAVRAWDLRTDLKSHALEFKADEKSCRKPLMSFDVNCNGQHLCAGTEKQKKDEDALLLFWDVRKTSFLGVYDESHDDDISHVKFHPNEPDTLATCSTDFLINVFDISQTDEDEALQFSLNAETSCGRLAWLLNRPTKHLSVVTHTEEVQIWDVEEVTMKHSFSREQIKEALRRRTAETCYAVRCFSTSNEDETLVLAGSSTPHRGCLRLLTVKNGNLEPHAILFDHNDTNSQVVRCALLHPSDGTVVSGGEDGIINVWKRGEAKPIASASAMVDLPTKQLPKGRSRKPYAK